jgi:LCP family protein required for cell wall assembly
MAQHNEPVVEVGRVTPVPTTIEATRIPLTATPSEPAVGDANPTTEPTIGPTSEVVEPTPAILQQSFTVLLIGVDTREEGPNGSIRSDTLILMRIDPEHNGASILSLPRDTLVTIPGKVCGGKRKINAAYACGFRHPERYGDDVFPSDAGAALAAETVEAFLDVKVDYTAQVDFEGFVDVVDMIGGIKVDVPKEIIDPQYPTADYGTMRLHIKKGLQHMDGEEALRYARTRHADSDFGRIQRQQQVMMEMLRQYKNQYVWQQLSAAPALLDIFGNSVQTTLPLTDSRVVRGLANLAEQLQNDNVQRFSLQPLKMSNGNYNFIEIDGSLQWNKRYVAQVVEEFQSPPVADEPIVDDKRPS